MRNVKTREGFEYWDKICSLKHYGFLHSPDGKRVVKTEGIGNWIDKFEAQEIVDQAQDEINQYRAERDALQQRLTAADERADVLEQALKFYADREHYHFESGNWDTVSGEPLNILWNGDEPDFIEDGSVARTALKPAEPEPYQGIPGTSFQRLNALANQGE